MSTLESAVTTALASAEELRASKAAGSEANTRDEVEYQIDQLTRFEGGNLQVVGSWHTPCPSPPSSSDLRAWAGNFLRLERGQATPHTVEIIVTVPDFRRARPADSLRARQRDAIKDSDASGGSAGRTGPADCEALRVSRVHLSPLDDSGRQ
jgi:hypothetical protein